MKICLIVDDYMPDSIKVAAKMMHELACEFLALGHDVTVITPSANLNRPYDLSVLDGVRIWRFKSGEIKNVGKIKRAINETLLSYRAWQNLKPLFRQNRHDLIVYYSPTIFWGSLVGRLKTLWNAPAYLVLRDFFPQWAIDQGLIRSGSAIEKYFRLFEAKNYSSADRIGVMSQKNLEWFNAVSDVSAPVEVLHNWAADIPVNASGKFRKSLKLEDKIIYYYGGNIGHAQDMMNIVRLARNMLNEPKAHFLIVGAGDEFDLVNNSIDRLHLTNMTLLPPVSQDVYKEMLAEIDIGLFSLHGDHTTHNFPGKLLGYMVQEKPILGSINAGNDVQNVVETAGAGLISLNGDDETFLANAIRLLHDPAFRHQTGQLGKQLLEKSFSVQSAAGKILSFYHDK
ncbi:MAG: glycosyltransferase family 4 protein [Sulfuricurvum sp.]